MDLPTLSLPRILEMIRDRRTIHNFKPEKPPKDLIMQALEAARWAPNHKLTEPWRFYLIGDETADAMVRLNAELVTRKKGAVAGRNKLTRWRSIPGWLAVTCRLSANPLRRKEDYAACCCAIQNMMLLLWSEGVGVKWGTGAVTRDPAFYELLGINPEEEEVVGLLAYGYPAEVPPSPPRKPAETWLKELP